MSGLQSIDLVIACGRRILHGRSEGAWDPATRAAVADALRDRSDGDPTIEGAITQAQTTWSDAEQFQRWLDQLERSSPNGPAES